MLENSNYAAGCWNSMSYYPVNERLLLLGSDGNVYIGTFDNGHWWDDYDRELDVRVDIVAWARINIPNIN